MDETLNQVLKEIGSKPLRSSIMTSACLMDTMLEKIIEKRFIKGFNKKMFSNEGCVGTFSSKIDLAFAMGIISKEVRDDIDIFRRIRNDCAHSLIIDSKITDKIKSRINNFNLIDKVLIMGENEDLLVYTATEAVIIFICLIKKFKNIEKLDSCCFEDEYKNLGFSDDDMKMINNFGELIKSEK